MVFTHMRGAVIPTSVSKGFLRACTLRSVAYSSTLRGLIKGDKIMADNFVKQIDGNYDAETNVYNSIFEQYERVVIQSLITSFGLDFLVRDQHGGDVDTIHNVRQIGKDEQMKYKNKKNEEAYNNRGEYISKTYHSHPNYINTNAKYSKQRKEGTLIDGYTGEKLDPKISHDLDHIVSAKEIHEDRGRVLSGLKGEDLANDPETNLTPTNYHTNRSKGQKSMDEYLEKKGAEYTEEQQERMRGKDRVARKAYNEKINRAYYTSSVFFKDTAKAAGKVGVAMGLRQVLGLVFSEIWFSVRDEIKQGKEDGKALFNSIALGVKRGLENAKLKYKELWHKFIEGAVGGVLASLTTTLCSIFFTTAKNVVRIIRQSWASLVEATKILLFNPDFLPFGERFRAAAKIIATGASVVAGTMVGDLIAKTGVAAIPVVGDIVQTFCGTLVTGILSCSLLYLLDRNSAVNKIVQVLNSIPTVDDIVVYYRTQARLLEEYCAKLMNIDLTTFQKEAQSYSEAVSILEDAANEQELNFALRTVCKRLEINSPIGNHKDMDSFMADPNSKLKFC